MLNLGSQTENSRPGFRSCSLSRVGPSHKPPTAQRCTGRRERPERQRKCEQQSCPDRWSGRRPRGSNRLAQSRPLTEQAKSGEMRDVHSYQVSNANPGAGPRRQDFSQSPTALALVLQTSLERFHGYDCITSTSVSSSLRPWNPTQDYAQASLDSRLRSLYSLPADPTSHQGRAQQEPAYRKHP